MGSQIKFNDFFPGTLQERYNMKKYLQIIEENLSLEIKILRLIHLGLPRSGKTTTQLRLFEEIINLQKDGKKFQCSTKLAEMRHLFIGLVGSNKWHISKNMQEEADLLSKLLSMTTENTTSSSDKCIDFSSQNSARMIHLHPPSHWTQTVKIHIILQAIAKL